MTETENKGEEENIKLGENEEKSRNKRLQNVGNEEPLDGGWGWLVAFGGFTVMGMNLMVNLAFGILFSRFLSSIKASSVTTAWIYNANGFVCNIGHLFVPPLCDVFGLRIVSIFGAMSFFSSIFFSSFAKNAWQLFFSYSLFGGIGTGLTVATAFFIIPKYFQKRRGAAMAIMMSGSSVGVFGGSLLITYLQDEFGYSGGTFILSAICLHCLPAVMVFHPVSWHSKQKPNEDKNTTSEVNFLLHRERSGEPYSNIQKIVVVLKELNGSVKNNLSMVKSCKAVLVASAISIAIMGFLNFNMMIPFWLQSIGFSIEEAAWCISISAITNLLTRVSVLFASDLKCFNVTTAYIAGTMVLALSSFALCFLKTRKGIIVFICIFSSGMGMNIGLFSLFIIDIMGMKEYQPTFGLSGFVKAFLYLTVGPLSGWIRDTSSYEASMIFLSSVISFSLVLFAFLPLASRIERRHLEAQRLDQDKI